MSLQMWTGLVPCWRLTVTGSSGWLGLGLQWTILKPQCKPILQPEWDPNSASKLYFERWTWNLATLLTSRGGTLLVMMAVKSASTCLCMNLGIKLKVRPKSEVV
jgi:hypothetical protein